jgi:hypothetical protein
MRRNHQGQQRIRDEFANQLLNIRVTDVDAGLINA